MKRRTVSLRALVGIRGAACERMRRAVDVGVFVRVEIREPVDDRLRLLRGGGIVEPDELSAVHPLLQNREVATDGVDVERRMSRRPGMRHAVCPRHDETLVPRRRSRTSRHGRRRCKPGATRVARCKRAQFVIAGKAERLRGDPILSGTADFGEVHRGSACSVAQKVVRRTAPRGRAASHGLSGTPSAAPPKRGSMAGATVDRVSGTPFVRDRMRRKRRHAVAQREDVASARTAAGCAPGTLPCGSARPGTPVPVPPGPASGEPGGAGLLAERQHGRCDRQPRRQGLACPATDTRGGGRRASRQRGEELGGKTRQRRDVRQARGRIRLRHIGRRRVAQRAYL